MKTYYFHVLQWIPVPVVCYGMNKKEAIGHFKRKTCLTKMPQGYKVWEAKP